MKNLVPYIKKILIVDCVIFLFCIVGAYQFSIKADFPFQVTASKLHVVVNLTNSSQEQIKVGDIITSVDGYDLRSREEVEIFLDGKRIGERVSIEIIDDEIIKTKQIELVPFYSIFYIIVAIVLGIIFFTVGIFVLINCKQKRTAITFHNAFIAIAMIILMTWGNYSLLKYSLGIITRIGFHIGYAFAPALFIRFTCLFPSELKLNQNRIVKFLYSLSFIEATLLSIFFILFTKTTSLEWMRIYITTFDVSSVYFAVAIIIGLIIFIQSYRKTLLESDRKKIRWILLGFLFGPGSYIIFWVIPQRITSHGLLPESIVLLLAAILPISFAIAILKHQAMNIDIIFKRSAVYSIVIVILLIIYILFLTLITLLFTNLETEIPAIIAAAMVAVFMNPVKLKAQKFVDKKFFKVQYNYRNALKVLTSELGNVNDIKCLAVKLIDKIIEVIPLKRIGFFATPLSSSSMHLINHKNFEILHNLNTNVLSNLTRENKYPILASPNKVEPGLDIKISTSDELQKYDIDLLFDLRTSENKTLGILICGGKRSETFFTAEDIDLLNNVCSRIVGRIERIKLHEELILKQLESKRLDELNKTKSYFISSVSHDLKTPLTSIKMFAELLKDSKELSLEKKNEYLNIIEGESSRLTRLIDNVLDYTKIEKGIKDYRFKEADLNDIVNNVIKSMEYQFEIEKFEVHCKFFENNLFVIIDVDAVFEALINLLSNAIKYSNKDKVVNIFTTIENKFAVIAVNDNGIGISEEEVENLFEPFYQLEKTKFEYSGGAGLGLSIVHHIMTAHDGKVEVESKIGIGSTFKLLFPLEEKNEKNFNN